MRTGGVLFSLILAGCLLNGCAIVKLRQDVQFSKDSCLVFGEVFSNSPLKKPIVVVAFSGEGDRIVVGDYAVLSAPGPYELLVRDGRYRIFAFEDANDNLAFDPGEWGAYYGKPDELVTQPGGVLWGLDIALSDTVDRTPPPLADSLLLYSEGRRKPCTSAGAVVTMDDPVFSAERGEKGFWAPLESFKLTGANLYFLEPYDPKKTPVVLVHGAAGSPQDWRYFIESLDRSRYQPWIFQYPSGARLSTMSFFLRKKLYDLHRKYDYDRMYVVAHSMGGLVARSALIEPDQHVGGVKLFVSISTPWGGEPLARMGVKHFPAVIPSWKDMEPESEFIRSLFARKLPDTMRYYLFFGHKGGGSLFRPNNDNTVTLESMLDPRAQAEALKVTGFNEDHVGILQSAEVIAHYRSIVESTEANLKKSYDADRGYVDIRHGYMPPGAKPPLQMAFVLVPAAGDEKETELKVNPLLTRQETRGVKPGEYEASLCAFGFACEPANVPVTVQGGKITEVNFTMRPQGMVAGLIAASTAGDDSYWGYFRDLPERVKIRAIRLAGTGVSRLLRPNDAMTDREVLKTFLASRDYAFKNQFVFFGLAAGEYTLSIEADGCEPYTSNVTVQPGEFVPPPPYRLVIK